MLALWQKKTAKSPDLNSCGEIGLVQHVNGLSAGFNPPYRSKEVNRANYRRSESNQPRHPGRHSRAREIPGWRLHRRQPDFKAKYGLQPDPVLSPEDLLRMDFATGLPSSNHLRRSSLEQFQEELADIQPIPQVPESVKEVIRRAKKLYIYGFFEYAFFTVAAQPTQPWKQP